MLDLIPHNLGWTLIPILGLIGIGVYTAIRHRWVTRESLRPGGSLVTTVIHPVWFEYALLLAAPALVMAWRDEERIPFGLLIAGVALLPIHIHRSRALFLSSLMAFWRPSLKANWSCNE